MTDIYGVIGNPVQQSKSPYLHQEFAKQTQQDIAYIRILAELDEFPQTLERFFVEGGKGANITIPFKEQAFQLVDETTDRAHIAEAVNTVYMKNDLFVGDNTDGVGLITDLTQNLRVSLQGKSILILGAGGAVNGILHPLLMEKPAKITIANRTFHRAQQAAKRFVPYGNLFSCDYSTLHLQKFDIIINGTSSSLQQVALPLPSGILNNNACCYDLAYNIKDNLFLKWAEQQHAAIIADGYGMLVEQAAEAFYIWRNVRPDTKSLL